MKPVIAPLRVAAVIAALVALSLFAVACGDDEEDSPSASESPSAEKVTVTAVEYEFDVSATPTADTTQITFKNDGKEFHVMLFARINEGFTLDQALKMEGEGGSATIVGQTEAPPGATKVVKITKPIKPGNYALLCPIDGKKGPHYKLGQLEEFEIQ